ncbi:MAG: DUF1501 domain-containing protein [Kiritimatiellae bacterium]|nr:DUF1501 domain-containing protein [Kiritimatiellia bacterium]
MSTNTQKASAKPTSRKFAKSVIEIWLWGGPSQLETFDPKPDAPHDYNNGLKSIKSANGYELHEWLPELAKCSNLYSIIRSMTHPFPGHETATYLMQTGRNPGGGVTFPALGALISSSRVKGTGKKNSVQSGMLYEGDLPPFVILTHAKGRFSEVGFLGEEYAPLVTGGSAAAKRFEVDGIVPPGGLTREQIVDRFGRASRIDRLPPDAEFEAAGAAAREIILGKAAETFDLTREKEQTRKRYGVKANGTTYTEIGQQLLAARRLVEYGVPYISINYSGWDSHKRHFETMKQPTFEMDMAVSALLTDLDERGLLDSTIVWLSGEFGRVPKVDRQPPWNGGRNHFPRCFSALVAGGGFKGGQVVGKSDETTDHWKERPVTPQDFLGSIMELAGVDPDDRLPNPKWLKEYGPVMNPAVKSQCGRLKEIYV